MCTYISDDEVGFNDCRECFDYEEAQQQIEQAQDGLLKLIPILYGKEDIDGSKLYDAIADMCDGLNVKHPNGLPRVRRMGSALFEFAASMHK